MRRQGVSERFELKEMKQKVKLFTHEVIIHAQIAALEKVLNRSVDCTIALNNRGSRSNIQFEANEKEIEQIKGDLGYTIMVLDQNRWMPYI
jgi:hypothetical protein